jgi:hypothetical protein
VVGRRGRGVGGREAGLPAGLGFIDLYSCVELGTQSDRTGYTHQDTGRQDRHRIEYPKQDTVFRTHNRTLTGRT